MPSLLADYFDSSIYSVKVIQFCNKFIMLYTIVYAFSIVLFVASGHGCDVKATKSSDRDVIVEEVTEGFGLAEGPHWDHQTQKLYFVDIYGQKLCRLDPATGTVTSVDIKNGPVGVAVPVEDDPDKFVAGAGTDFVLITWKSDNNNSKPIIEVLGTVDTDRNNTRFNDGKVDSSGRFWGGTMGPEENGVVTPNQGSLYMITGDRNVKKVVSPVTISNGLAWSLEDDTFYYIDSLTYQVVGYDYDPLNGTISNKRVIFDLKKNNVSGIPDGMTIDTNGNLWIALYTGHGVIQINPKTSELLRTIRIPADRVTSVAFGGPLLDTLYVTTSSYGLDKKQLQVDPKAGSLFAVKGLGVRGLLPSKFKLNVQV